MIRLYDYFRSSACYRVRIALRLKGLDYQSVSVNLLKGEQQGGAYKGVNPQGAVPYFIDGDVAIGQSLAIIEYLDALHPEPSLVYGAAVDQAYIRQLALLVACDMHGLSQPSVWKAYLQDKLGVSEAQSKQWLEHWLGKGFSAYEALLHKQGRAGRFSCGDAPSMADLCLIPQLYNARRNGIALDTYPKIREIERNCITLKAFQEAAPENQSDAPEDLAPIHGFHSPLNIG